MSSLFRGRKKQFAMKSIICGSTPRNISTVALPFVTRLKSQHGWKGKLNKQLSRSYFPTGT